MEPSSSAEDPQPPISVGFALMRDLCRMTKGAHQLHRFYAAAADCAERNPDLAARWEETADARLTGRPMR